MGGLIAVVEDEPELQALYRLVLKSKGYRVAYVSADAEDAVCKYEHCPVKPDLVIMDRRLENSSGEEAAQRICRLHPGARILFATADTDHSQLSGQPNVVGVLQKPFSLDAMFRAIEGAIGDGESRMAM
ncbi:MAG: two-component response regulator [Methanocella sp. PtaU1.Bin125]|nr:MAG: two-component response regulator [Methanocella sp. PtaU1.Bin125]